MAWPGLVTPSKTVSGKSSTPTLVAWNALDINVLGNLRGGTRKVGDQEGEAKPLCVKVGCVAPTQGSKTQGSTTGATFRDMFFQDLSTILKKNQVFVQGGRNSKYPGANPSLKIH